MQPKDSQHPDRDANLQVFVETWLTEEEFQEAKAQKRLAWQDSPKPPIELDTKLEELKVSSTIKTPSPTLMKFSEGGHSLMACWQKSSLGLYKYYAFCITFRFSN